MPPTRRTPADNKSSSNQQQQQQAQRQEQLNKSTQDNEDHNETEVNQLLGSLSEESKSLVKVLTIVITKNITKNVTMELERLKEELTKKDTQISNLTEEVRDLKMKVQDLELNIDSVDQYERRDTIIISGPLIPEETPQENTTHTVTSLVKENLKINISESDINITHRIGPKQAQRKRAIIVKLNNRSLKSDLVGACIQLKPQLYINESLTPKRLHIFKQVLNIRRVHREKFQQCHTKDGKIIVKLRNSTVKHEITDERTLMAFLDKYPLMKDTYLQTDTPN